LDDVIEINYEQCAPTTGVVATPTPTRSKRRRRKASSRLFAPKVDVKETDQELVIRVDVPGAKKEDISLELVDDILTIGGEVPEWKKEEGERWRVAERDCGKFQRRLTMPPNVDASKIKATYQDGVLDVHVPTPSNLTPKKIEIK